MRRLLLTLTFLTFPGFSYAQPVVNNQGEQLNLCRMWDGTDVALVDGSGNQMVAGTLTCNAGSGTFAISAASLPLPTGASTSALQDGIVKDGAGDTTQANVVTGRLKVDGSDVTQPVSAASLPLPTGASTSALQDGIIKDGAGDTTQANVVTGRLKVDGSDVTQPVSGTITVTDGAGVLNVIVDSGTTAVTQATASSLNAEVQGDAAHDATLSGNPVLMGGASSAAAPADVSADGEAVRAWHLRNGAAATVITAAGALVGGDAANGLDVDVTRLPALVAGTANIGDVDVLTLPNVTLAAGTNTNEVVGDVADGAAVAGNPVLIAGQDGTNAQSIKTDSTGSIQVDVETMPTTTVTATNLDVQIGGSDTVTVTGNKTTNNAAPGATNVGVLPAVAEAAAPSFTEGNLVALSTNLAGALRVTGGGGGTEYVTNAVAPADPTGTTLVSERDDQLATLTEIEGDWTNTRATSKGALWVAIPDTNGDPITSFGGGTEYNQGTATTDTDTLKMAGAVRRDTAAVATGVIDGDRLALSTDSAGRLRTTAVDTTQPVSATNLDVQIGGSDTVTVTATNLDVQIGGSDTVTVAGAKSDNGGAPGATNLGTLPAVALAADPTRTEGNQVGLRTQLDGDLVVAMVDEIPAGTQNIGDVDIVSGTITTVTTVTNLTNLPNEGQQTAANSISVTPDTDNDAIGATAAAVPGEAVYVAGTDGTNVTPFYVDPCEREARTAYRVDIVTATTTEIAAATASEFYYVCSINLLTAAANNVIIVEDDTATNCPSPTAGVSSGGTTSAEGYNFAANGGIVVGNGQKWVMKTTTANRSFCIITSAATQLSGTITYVSAP